MRKLAITIGLSLLAMTVHANSNSGNFSMSFDLSAHKSDSEVKLWIPYPVSDQNQYISNISWQGNYQEAAVYTDQANGTAMLFASWPKNTKSRKLTFSFDADRKEQVRRDFPETAGTFNPADFSHYLAATSLGPIDGGVKELADSITGDRKSILAKARAIYDWTVEQTFRDPKTRGCGLGDVNQLLKRPGGKCADISSIFVALTRASGVPSREVFGLRSGNSSEQNVTRWQHCWAEFYLPGYGWVPVDPADVRKAMLKQNLQADSLQANELRAHFWGAVDPYRIRLGEGRDLILNPPHKGPPLNYLMYPFAQTGDKTIDWLEPDNFSYAIHWRPLK